VRRSSTAAISSLSGRYAAAATNRDCKSAIRDRYLSLRQDASAAHWSRVFNQPNWAAAKLLVAEVKRPASFDTPATVAHPVAGDRSMRILSAPSASLHARSQDPRQLN
jgi:hypothetical protein